MHADRAPNDSVLDALGALVAPELDAAFDAAGLSGGHAPFVAWLVAALRPRRVLGAGAQLAPRHDAAAAALGAGPGELVALLDLPDLEGWAGAHLARYAGRSRLLAPGDALPQEGPFDLLHVDETVRAAVLSRPDLRTTPDAVLLVAGAAPGRRPLLLHDGTLRIEPLGDRAPPLVAALAALVEEDGPRLARLRTRFAALAAAPRARAERAAAEARAAAVRGDASLRLLRRRLAEALVESGRRADALSDRTREAEKLAEALREREAALAAMGATLRGRDEAAAALRAEAEALHAALAAREAQLDEARRMLATEAASRAAAPRGWRRFLPPAPPPPALAAPDPVPHEHVPAAGAAREPEPEPEPAPAPAPEVAGGEGAVPLVLFVSGEPGRPGEVFRVDHQAEAAAACGFAVRKAPVDAVGPETIAGVDVLVLWRAAWSDHVRTMIELCRAGGATIVFDTDDLVIDPQLANPAVIGGMREAGIASDDLAGYFARLRRTAAAADLCIATTEELAGALRGANPRATVLPNGFDAAHLSATRLAARVRQVAEPDTDGLVRIGYAAGTRTHARDFAVVAAPLARLLAIRPAVRLVLFRPAGEAAGTVPVEAFDELAPFADRIEWRDLVPFAELPAEIARFDIAICPLEADNPFCEAKSEWKHVEAALASIPCVASPTGPFRRAITDGETGLLAADAEAWFEALLRLVDEPSLRARLGFAAFCDVLWRFGPRPREEFWTSLVEGRRDPARRAHDFELAVRRGERRGFGTPVVAPTTVLFAHDALRTASVAVAITSYNYAEFVGEALDSVAAQTLDALELVVVDDGSSDDSVATILAWAERHASRFVRLVIARTVRNAGLGPARNAAFAACEAAHIMSLDADNRLRPACCEALLATLLAERAAFAYATTPQFGDMAYAVSAAPWDPDRLVPGNYVDAMALVAKWAWAAAGGYYDNPDARGWEDFDLWCRLAELGQHGAWNPEPLCEYRVHAGSMTNAVTERDRNKRALVAFLEARHGWLRIRSREEALRL